MSKKQKRNLEVVSKIDSEIVEKATQERSNLLLALKRRIKKMWLIRGGAMAASLLLVATTVLLVVLLAKEVPVYTGMTVSNTAPTTVASVTLPDYLDPGNGNGNAYGNKHLQGDHTDADKTIGENPFETPIGDAVGAFQVQSAEPRYYAKPNEDVYITVHIDNPDDFVILSFTLNGQMYTSYMFEEGSDLENLILKVNVGDVEGVVSYTIDAIKYVDGTKIKDVKIGGERTVEIGVYTENQPAAAFSDLVLGFNSISFAVDVSDTKNLFETLTGSVEAVLYDGESIVARKSISATGKTTVTFDGLATGALYECAIVATYDALDGEGIARHILSSHAAYTKSIVLFDKVEIGTTTLSFDFLWDAAFAAKTVTGLALYQNGVKVRDIEVSATTIEDLVSDTTYTLVATYQNGSADEEISITFTTDALFVTVNQYLEALDGTYTLLETVTETVAQGTVYTPTLGNHVGFTTPTVAPVTMTARSHTFECYFERITYEVTFHYNSAQGIANESIKFGKPLTPTVAPTREDFTFGGWYLDAAFTTPAGEIVPAESISLYAKWLLETDPSVFRYEINDGKITLTDLESGVMDLEELVIPAYIGGYPVTAIAWNGYHLYEAGFAYKIASVTIPDTVTIIGELAFSGWRQLASITIPDSVTTIGKSAFAGCLGLTSITIPASVTTIGDSAFSRCTSLSSIEIPASVTTIGRGAFADCMNLSSITIPASVTTIGEYAFSRCTSLSSITIPDSVTSIGEYAFYDCSNLSIVNFGANSQLESIGDFAFYRTSLTSVEIPDSVTTIGDSAFGGCTNLTSIEIPNSVTIIGDSAFENCTSLASISFGANSQLESIGESAFCGCTGLSSIMIPDNVSGIGFNAFGGCTGLVSIELPFAFAGEREDGTYNERFGYFFGERADQMGGGISRVPTTLTTVVITGGKNIGEYAFFGCTSITSITISSSVTTIGAYAFVDCTSLNSVTFEKRSTVLSIGCSAFFVPSGLPDEDSSPMEKVYVEDAADWLYLHFADYGANPMYGGNTAFYCNGQPVTEIIAHDDVTSISNYAFSGYMGLVSIRFGENSQLTTVGERAFFACRGLESVVLPSGMTTVCDYAFAGCWNTSISLGENNQLTTIGKLAFSNCRSLTGIALPKAKTIGKSAFVNCWSLASVSFGENSQLTTIGELAFTSCKSLLSITIPDSVTSIGDHAFANCTGLTSVSFGANSQLESIGESAFSGCLNLASVSFGANSQLKMIDWYVFSGCTSLSSITIPASVTTIGDGAFLGCAVLTSITFEKRNTVLSIGSGAFCMPYDAPENGISSHQVEKVYVENSADWLYLRFYDLGANPLYGGNTVLYCNNQPVTEIVAPDDVTSISNYAFPSYRGLTGISFGENSQLTSIGNSAFSGCTNLESVSFGVNSQLESIGYSAFDGCTSLASITIPDSLTTIGNSAFRDCTSLESVSFGANSQLESIGDSAFSRCTSLASITIPDSLTSIGSYAFGGCTNLTSVDFANTSGWYTSSGQAISATDLENTATAARYLTNTHIYSYWQRS